MDRRQAFAGPPYAGRWWHVLAWGRRWFAIDVLEVLDGSEAEAVRRTGHPRQVEPQLAMRGAAVVTGPGWVHERKLDGVRLVVHLEDDEVRLVTRTGLERSATFPELPPAIRELGASDLVADGEVVALEGEATSFGRLQRRLGRSRPGRIALDVPVHLYLFDLLYVDGFDLRGVSLVARKRLLRTLGFTEPVRYTPHRDDDVGDHFAEACERGWEGLVAKRGDAPYRSGRSPGWLKLPCYRSGRFVVGGWTEPRGGRVGIGALLLGRFEGGRLRYVGKVGTGFDTPTLEILATHLAQVEQVDPPFEEPPVERSAHWALPHLVVEARFAGWTSIGRLRQPTVTALRPDLAPAEAVGEAT